MRKLFALVALAAAVAIGAPRITLPAAGGASPLTTKGDVYVYSTANDRLPVGANGLCLQADSTTATGLKYASCGGGAAFQTASAVLNFGVPATDEAVTWVPASWATGVSVIACTLSGLGVDGGLDDECLLELVHVQAQSQDAGVGFWLHGVAPLPIAELCVVHCTGA